MADCLLVLFLNKQVITFCLSNCMSDEEGPSTLLSLHLVDVQLNYHFACCSFAFLYPIFFSFYIFLVASCISVILHFASFLVLLTICLISDAESFDTVSELMMDSLIFDAILTGVLEFLLRFPFLCEALWACSDLSSVQMLIFRQLSEFLPFLIMLIKKLTY